MKDVNKRKADEYNSTLKNEKPTLPRPRVSPGEAPDRSYHID